MHAFLSTYSVQAAGFGVCLHFFIHFRRLQFTQDKNFNEKHAVCSSTLLSNWLNSSNGKSMDMSLLWFHPRSVINCMQHCGIVTAVMWKSRVWTREENVLHFVVTNDTISRALGGIFFERWTFSAFPSNCSNLRIIKSVWAGKRLHWYSRNKVLKGCVVVDITRHTVNTNW